MAGDQVERHLERTRPNTSSKLYQAGTANREKVGSNETNTEAKIDVE